MILELTSFEKAIKSLKKAIEERKRLPENEFVRDSCIQRFEYTYELSWKMLKRYLHLTSGSPSEVPEMSFQDLIRTGAEKGLLLNSWDKWSLYRKLRGTTSHAYDEDKAQEVLKIVPDFHEEAIYLLKQLQRRAI